MKFSSEQPKIIVVGSSSIDLVLNTEKFPMPNETVLALKSESFFGGKGANQAVGTARLGASVYFVGCVGMDPHGQQVMRNLVNEGVNVGYVVEAEEAVTGTAYVTASEGKNAIIVVPAANYELKPKHIDEVEKYIAKTDMVLLQLEVPMAVVEHTVKLAKKYETPVGIYAAPAQQLSREVIEHATFIVAKYSEIHKIFGNESSGEELMRRYANKLFVRDDANSTTFYNGEEMRYFRNEEVDILHKMGMGDAFTSGFAVAYCHKNSIEDCVRFGNDVSLKVAAVRSSQRGLPYKADYEA